jgi:hypothetical protein
MNNSVALVRGANYTDRATATCRRRTVSATDPHGRIIAFLDGSHYFFQVIPRLYSRGRVDPIPDLLRKSGSAGNLTRTSGSVDRNCEH